jgi:hypothetical protein
MCREPCSRNVVIEQLAPAWDVGTASSGGGSNAEALHLCSRTLPAGLAADSERESEQSIIRQWPCSSGLAYDGFLPAHTSGA